MYVQHIIKLRNEYAVMLYPIYIFLLVVFIFALQSRFYANSDKFQISSETQI